MRDKSRRVVITGGAGFIGSHIADQLVKRGGQGGYREIIVFDNFVRGRPDNLAWAIKNGPVRIVEGDVRDRDAVAKVMRDVDLVFHEAAIRITQCAVDPRLALEVLVNGTYNVLEAAVEAKVGRVVAASSASVYGLADEFPTDEDHHPYNDLTFYGAAKTFNEGVLRSFRDMYGLNYVALRYFNAYGPRMDVHGKYTEVMIRWMERIEAGQPPLIFGDGAQTMDFVYVEDIARANLLAAESSASGAVFNVASGTETSLSELARLLTRVMGAEMQPEHCEERKVNPVRRRLADTGRAREMLGFESQVPLEEGLERLVAWWRTQKQAAVS